MSRINRIRQEIVAKAIGKDGWWDEGRWVESADSSDPNPEQTPRHILHHSQGRRRHIIERLFDISVRGLTK